MQVEVFNLFNLKYNYQDYYQQVEEYDTCNKRPTYLINPSSCCLEVEKDNYVNFHRIMRTYRKRLANENLSFSRAAFISRTILLKE